MPKRRFVDLSIYLENEVSQRPACYEAEYRLRHTRHWRPSRWRRFFPALRVVSCPTARAGRDRVCAVVYTQRYPTLMRRITFIPTMNEQAGGKERAITID